MFHPTNSCNPFHRWQNVERRRKRGSLFKIAHPELGSRKFPFCITMLLEIKFNLKLILLKWASSVHIIRAMNWNHILTSIVAYEFDIMAISRLSSTITLITQYDPNIRRPQKRVYDLIPSSSKFSMPTIPKLAQNSDWDDSNRLKYQNSSMRIIKFYDLRLNKLKHYFPKRLHFIQESPATSQSARPLGSW